MSLLHKKAAGATVPAKLYVDDVFSTYLYTGTSAANTITNGIDLAGEGGMVWIKGRDVARDHYLFDTERPIGGGVEGLRPNSTIAAFAAISNLSSFNSDGFSLGINSQTNFAGSTFASWTFRKAPKFFDVVTYTGDGHNGRTVAHSLDAVPGMMIVKSLFMTGSGGPANWSVYHQGVSPAKSLNLNLTNAAATNNGLFGTPTSTDFVVHQPGGGDTLNALGDEYVAYLFAHDTDADGLIQCGSYAGTSSDLSVNLGWEPQYVLIKSSTATEGWHVMDTMRGITSGGNDPYFLANTSNAEVTSINLLSVTPTGFELRPVFNPAVNSSGNTYIYMAIRRPNKPPTVGAEVYNAIARTGTNAAATITGLGFTPDASIHRSRTGAEETYWRARTTGAGEANRSNRAVAATVSSVFGFRSFDMDGFTVAGDTSWNDANGSTLPYINHFFKRAPGFFDVVAYTGTGVAHTEAHSLGVVPEMMILKNRLRVSIHSFWPTYVANAGTGYLRLNEANAYDSFTGFYTSSAFTDSTVTITGGGYASNFAGDSYIAYLFATLDGISKVGSYTGNGSSQTIDCGFAAGARFALIKRTDSTGDWYIWDTTRGIVAGNDPHLSLNTTAAEVTGDDSIDPDNSGFIVNQVAATNINVTSATYIFLSIA